MTCRVVNATITDAFQDLKVSFFSNHSEAQPINLNNTKPEIDGGRRRGWFSNVYNSVVNTVNDVANTVVDAAAFVFDGNLHKQFTTPWTPYQGNYNIAEFQVKAGQDSVGTASATFSGSMDLGININIDISSYSLQSFSASVNGKMQASLQATLTAEGVYSDQGSTQMKQLSIATGTIPIFGILVPVTLFLDISAGFNLKAQATGTISGSVSASGIVSAGFNYDGSSLLPSADFDFQAAPSFNGPTLHATTLLEFHIMPELYLQVFYIGGPTLSLPIYAQVNAQALPRSSTSNDDASVGASAASTDSWCPSGFPIQVDEKV